MNYYTAKKIHQPFQNCGNKYLPSELFSSDWKVGKGFQNGIIVSSESLNMFISLYENEYNKMTEKYKLKEGENMTFSTFGWVSEERFYLAEDIVENTKTSEIKKRNLKNHSLYEDILGDRYFINKDKILRGYLKMGSFSVYQSEFPLFKLAEEQEIVNGSSILSYFGKRCVLNKNQYKNLSFINEIGIGDLTQHKTKIDLLSKEEFMFNNISIAFKSSTDLVLRQVELDPREYSSEPEKEEFNNISQYKLLFVLNKEYDGFQGTVKNLDNQDGDLYIQEYLFSGNPYLTKELDYIKITDIGEFKERIQLDDCFINDLIDSSDKIDFSKANEHYIIPSLFIGA